MVGDRRSHHRVRADRGARRACGFALLEKEPEFAAPPDDATDGSSHSGASTTSPWLLNGEHATRATSATDVTQLTDAKQGIAHRGHPAKLIVQAHSGRRLTATGTSQGDTRPGHQRHPVA
ncbi:hypothetical protein GCM10020229_33910 [Kitasatospora albolonga]